MMIPVFKFSLVVLFAVSLFSIAAGKDDLGQRGAFLEMRKAIGRGDYCAAAERINALLERFPSDLSTYESLAEISLYTRSATSVDRILQRRMEFGEEVSYVRYGLGILHKNRKEYSVALDYLTDALNGGLDVPEIYSAISECYCRTHMVEESIRYFTAFCHRQPTNANAWYALSLVYWEARNYQQIANCIDRAIGLAPDCLSYLQLKISCLVLLRRFGEAAELAKSVMGSADMLNRPTTFFLLSHSLAYSQIQLAKYSAADTTLVSAIEIARQYGYRSACAWLSVLRANLCYLTGRYHETLSLCQGAREQAVIVGDSVLKVETYIWEHQAFTELGQCDDGLIAACVAGLESIARRDNLQILLSLASISLSCQELGMDSLSLDLAIEAMARMEEDAPDPYTRLLVKVRLSEAYLAVGNIKASIDLLSGFERRVPTHVQRAIVAAVAHGVLGNACLQQSRYEESARHFRKEINLARMHSFTREECSGTVGLALVNLRRGRIGPALQYFREALLLCETTRVGSLRLRVLEGFAEFWAAVGVIDSAECLLQIASEECWRALPKLDFDYRHNKLWDTFRCLVRRHVELLMDMGRVERAFLVSQRLAWVPVHEQPPRITSDSEYKALAFIGAQRKKLGHLLLSHCRAISTEQRHEVWSRSEPEMMELLSVLASEAESRKNLLLEHAITYEEMDRATDSSAAATRAFLASKPDEVALVQFVVGQRRTIVFVVRGDQVRFSELDLGDHELRLLLNGISTLTKNGGLPLEAVNRYSAEFDSHRCEELGRRVVVPWLRFVAGATKIAVLRDGCLQGFPLEILKIPHSPSRTKSDSPNLVYVVEEFALHYVMECQECIPAGGPVPGTLVRVAVVSANQSSLPSSAEDGKADPAADALRYPHASTELIGLRQETIEIGNLLQCRYIQLDNEEPTVCNFAESAENSEVIHVAAHYVFKGPSGLLSAICFATRSGKRGTLEACRLFGIRFRSRLVVLSGCNTAGVIGRDDAGFGFAGVIHSQGVPSSVGTLWPVDDVATSKMMIRFYDEIARGKSVARALQLAKVQMIHSEMKNPYLWGGFVLVGRDEEFARMTESVNCSLPKASTARTTMVAYLFIIALSVLSVLAVVAQRIRGQGPEGL